MKHALYAGVALAACAMSSHALAGQLTAWVIDGDSEKPYFTQLEESFNAEFGAGGVTVDVVPIPSYNEAIQAATLSGDLPDVIMVDGPNMASMAWTGTIQPIGAMLDPAILNDLLPAVLAQGTYGPTGEVYFVSPYDSGTILWGNRAMLEEAGVRIPTSVDDAWTRDEMAEALKKLAALPQVEWPLDVKMNYGAGEWMTYGFSPFAQSNGGDIIDRQTWTAEGTINSAANVNTLTTFQDWNKAGYIVPASAGDNKFYGEKTAALSWVGNWMWPAHREGLGDDLVLIPPPAFGDAGPISANGGWGWAVPTASTNLEDIKTFLNFAMSSDQVAAYADTTGYVPSRTSAIPMSETYGAGGAGEIFAHLAACCSVVRPVHPAYPVITNAWATAVVNVLSGDVDVKAELDRAAQTIDQDIADSDGYPPFGQ
ncbi:MAG: extracellular solute-binding protein [Devosia sp.]|uniref:sugar ABC transporter substrate-binding protein n=1 Tax=Devosia sp. TaxID=1871048 RepID=UPI0024C73E67|nr:extracellular solute-binding protein [Devosia sp.]UYN98958.1 MAG: extracellular solute-binding protein [Devosia sp.]